MKKLILSTAILVAASFIPSSAYAVDGILQPVSVSSSVGSNTNFLVNNLIDGSGLSSSYARIGNFTNINNFRGDKVTHNFI